MLREKSELPADSLLRDAVEPRFSSCYVAGRPYTVCVLTRTIACRHIAVRFSLKSVDFDSLFANAPIILAMSHRCPGLPESERDVHSQSPLLQCSVARS